MTEKTHVVKDQLNTPVEEAYRVLRTNLQFCGFDKKIRTIAVTSCNPGEGKTTTSINLAISLAKSGMKTLLIDADLRKPMLAKHLGSENKRGLTNLISGVASLEEVINRTNIENFYFISCGAKPPNPAELVGSARFSEFMQTVSEQFDMVIFDTPPLGSVIDCALIARQTDGTLLVIESNAVEYPSARRVKEQLEKVNARILGVVLNKMAKNEYRSYYNYYYNYGNSKSRERGFLSRLKKIFSGKRRGEIKVPADSKVMAFKEQGAKKEMPNKEVARKELARG
jgi:capsular exopolysaccharide synthesis family protein